MAATATRSHPSLTRRARSFAASDALGGWLERFPTGGPGSPGAFRSDPMRLEGGFRSLITSADASAGYLVPPDRKGLIEPGLVRPLTLRQLVTVLSTESDLIDWIRESSRISAAAPVTEAAQLAHTGDVTATKPEGGVTFARETTEVKTFAVWIPATKRIVADATGLGAYVDALLRDDLGVEVEDQIVAGTDGEGFTGLFNTSGTQTAGPPSGGLTEIDLIRRALRLIRINARIQPTGILVNPEDAERWDQLKDGYDQYPLTDPRTSGGVPNLWGVPVVESEACPAGRALVGDFRKAILFDREDVQVSVGTADQDFIRNIVRLLAETRLGFAVVRPSAFVEVDLIA
jgi:HK97 family phage major capsid protein